MIRRAVVLTVCLFALSTPAVSLAQQTPPAGLTEFSQSLEQLSASVAPAVVQVFVRALASAAASDDVGLQRRGGSGVIVSTDGYLITNAHVVRDAQEVEVLLSQPAATGTPGRSIVRPLGTRVRAVIVGVDWETDLAILKIEIDDAATIEFGDSDELRAGQIVLAFGSPLGLETSVTMGVVSAVGRQLQPDAPMVYIQTDAPINPGNSGGPLVNTKGELIGINTLIASPTGASAGIGFAAPSNIVRQVYRQIRSHGRVRRGVIGVHVQTITPTVAQGLGLIRDWGVVVSDVEPRSPAAMAGVTIGDVIAAVNGKPMENARQFDVNVYRWPIGTAVMLDIRRGPQQVTLRVPVMERADDLTRLADLVDPERSLIAPLGVLALDLTPDLAQRLPWLRYSGGVLVAARAADAPARDVDLQPGDVIHTVNGQPITTLGQLRAAIRLPHGTAIVLQIDRGGRLRFVGFPRP